MRKQLKEDKKKVGNVSNKSNHSSKIPHLFT